MNIKLPDHVKFILHTLEENGYEGYAVGGCVRDALLGRDPQDWDITTNAKPLQVKALFRRTIDTGLQHGTVTIMLDHTGYEVTTYRIDGEYHDGRHPDSVEFTSNLKEDLKRRDFTINAMAISVNSATYGKLLDPFDGIGDLERRIIRTPLDPDITFSDDPLRMMRAIRFATQLDFEIFAETFEAIRRNKERIKIISKERIIDELTKIIKSKKPSRGFVLLSECGLMELIFPELAAMKGVETVNGRGHKDNFWHTMQVLDNVAEKSDNEWLRWAAVFHDLGKPATKSWDEKIGWTFHNHNFIGEKMVPRIFTRMKLPLNEHMKYVKKLVGLHMRPIALVEDEVTDSAVRRLLFDAGDDIDDLMLLCEADITSKNQQKVQRLLQNFALVRKKLIDIEEKDRVRNFQPPVSGEEIMATFGLQPTREVGVIKNAIKDAILDGVIENDYEQARQYMLKVAAENGLTPVK